MDLNRTLLEKRQPWPILLPLIFAVTLFGCSTMSDIKERATSATMKTVKKMPLVGGPDTRMLRQVGLISFENHTYFQDLPLHGIFQAALVKHLTESCDHVRIIAPGSENYPQALETLPIHPSGEVDNLALAQTGRQMGFNGIITGGAYNIAMVKEEEGILWFRDLENKIRIQLLVEVFGTETATKLFSERFIHQIDTDLPESGEFRFDNPAVMEALNEAMDEIGEEMAEKICETVLSQPWTGFVLSSRSDRAILSFGEKIGAKPGQIFDVFASGEMIKGLGGLEFIVPGDKIGQVKISSVEPDISVAQIITGEGIEVGCSVKLPSD